MKFIVKEYFEPHDYYKCEDEDGNQRQLDLTVNGDFPKLMNRKDLVGKMVEVEYTHPFLEIAHNVKVVE